MHFSSEALRQLSQFTFDVRFASYHTSYANGYSSQFARPLGVQLLFEFTRFGRGTAIVPLQALEFRDDAPGNGLQPCSFYFNLQVHGVFALCLEPEQQFA